MMPHKTPPAPVEVMPDPAWDHYTLYMGVRDSIASLPLHFRTETVIGGIMATDLFTLGAALGATIEEQFVETLNSMREQWDPEKRYSLYHFHRQPQTFPDVLLRKTSEAGDVILGLELKGWYLLAKEGEPSFRYQVTPQACNLQDLVVVIPWALSNVISGTPKVFAPYMVSARFAAEYRNYHWRYLREAKSDAGIKSPKRVSPYPCKSDEIADRPASDAGGNFGRFSRTGLMDAYLKEASQQTLCGIEAQYWRSFFKAFHEHTTPDSVHAEVERLVSSLSKGPRAVNPTTLARVQTILRELEGLVSE
jgi:hypothetical protein